MSHMHLFSWLNVARGFLLALTLLISGPSHSAQILAIDIAGNIHSVDPETGSFATLFGVNLGRARGLDRTPGGDLYTTSLEGAGRRLYKINENDFSVQPVGEDLGATAKEFAFQSDAVVLVTTDAGSALPVLLRLDLAADSIELIDFIRTDLDITAIEIRSDGALVGIQVDHSDDGSASLVEINPQTAELRTIANLSGINARDLGGIVTTETGAYFVSSSVNGVVSHIWSLDLYTGEHSLRSTVVGIEAIVGVALPIPEPGSALLMGLGLFCLSAIRKNGRNVYGVLAFLSAVFAQPAIGTEISQLLGKACESGEVSPESCAQLWSCIEDPEGCSAGSNSATESLGSIEPFGGEVGAMMAPVSGSSIAFRVNRSESPMMSPDGNWGGFDELNGIVRVHRYALDEPHVSHLWGVMFDRRPREEDGDGDEIEQGEGSRPDGAAARVAESRAGG